MAAPSSQYGTYDLRQERFGEAAVEHVVHHADDLDAGVRRVIGGCGQARQADDPANGIGAVERARSKA